MSQLSPHSGSRKSGRLGLKRPVAIAVPDALSAAAEPEADSPSAPAPPQRPALPPLLLGPPADAFATPDFEITLSFDWSVPDLPVDLGQFACEPDGLWPAALEDWPPSPDL
jgi:hypothetical protein